MAGTGGGAPGATPTVWVDDQDVDPSWSVPGSERPRQQRLLTVGVPVLLLVLVVIAVVAAGGFRVRTDGPIPTEPGQLISTGPYEFTFANATVQNVEGYGDHPRVEEVIVYGTGRNTWTESLRLDGDEFLGRSTDGQVLAAELAGLESEEFFTPDELTPGVGPQPITVSFEFPPDAAFADRFRFSVRELVYRNDSIFSSSDEENWTPDGRRTNRLQLPLKRLPREEDF